MNLKPKAAASVSGVSLRQAVESNQADVVRDLLSKDSSRAALNRKDGEGRTVLMIASSYGYFDVARMLIEAGAKTHHRNESGESALDLAVESRRSDPGFVPLFTEAGERATVSHLLRAVQASNVPVVKALVAAGIDVNGTDVMPGAFIDPASSEEKRKAHQWSALMLAAYMGNLPALNALLKLGAEVNLRAGNRTAMSVANDAKIIQALIAAGASDFELTGLGNESLEKACLLLDHGARLSMEAGELLLEWAVSKGYMSLASRLLQRGPVTLKTRHYLGPARMKAALTRLIDQIASAEPALLANLSSPIEEAQALISRARANASQPSAAQLASLKDVSVWLEGSTPLIPMRTPNTQRSRAARWPVIHWADGERERILAAEMPSVDAKKADKALLARAGREEEVAPSLLLSATPGVLVPAWNEHALTLVMYSFEGDLPIQPGQVLLLLARHGEAILPGLLLCSRRMLERDHLWERQRRELMEKLALALLHVEHPDIAPVMSSLAWSSVDPKPPGLEATLYGSAIDRSPWWRVGRTWLLRFPEAAARGLLAPALDEKDPHAALARAGLTVLAQSAEGQGAIIDAAAALGGNAVHAAQRILEKPFIPGKLTASSRQTLPSGWRPGALPRPVLVDSGKQIPNEAITALADALTQSSNLVRHPLVARALRDCTRESLADFAWAILQQSIKDESLTKPIHAWMLSALSWFGDDRCAKGLASLIREWPRSNYTVRALRGLEILGDIGTDAAMAQLQSLTMRNRYTPTVAAQVLEAVAAERGFSRDQLDDRSVPTLGLDDQGSMRLNVGGPEIVVTIDEAFTPQVHVAGTKPTAKWPKTVQGSDVAKLKAATEEWKSFVADLKVTAGLQAVRLERAMVKARAWRVPDFLAYCVGQPLLRAPVRGLVWGTRRYSEEGPLKAFVVTDDGGVFEDVDGKSIELEPDSIVQLIHPIELGADLSKWLARWKDLGRGQPIAQLSRKLYRANDDVDGTLFGLRGARIPSGAFRGLLALGWQRDMAGVAGWLEGFRKPTDSGCVWISVDPGIHIDSPGFEETHQTLTIHDFPALSDIEFSEIVREMQTLRQ